MGVALAWKRAPGLAALATAMTAVAAASCAPGDGLLTGPALDDRPAAALTAAAARPIPTRAAPPTRGPGHTTPLTVPPLSIPGSEPDADDLTVAPPVPSAPSAPSAPTVPPTLPAVGAGDVEGLAALFGCLPDGARSNGWTVRFAGYGCAAIGVDGGSVLALRPRAAASADATHAGLVLGPSLSSRDAAARFRVRVFTARQLRTGSAPNPWEVAWVVWHYTDDDHFYYFIAKPNGWELGKRDPAYPGGQRFLATGSERRFPVGQWYDVDVAQRGATITVSVDGRTLVMFEDRERPYTAGAVGLYSEDAAVVGREPAAG